MHISETEMLRMALIGYGLELVKIEEADSGRCGRNWRSGPEVNRLQRRNGNGCPLEGRARIVAAVHKRWAAYRRGQKGARRA